MPNVAQSVTLSNYTAIMTALHDIAINNSGLAFAGSKLYEMPYPKEILDAGGSNYLVVRYGVFAGYGNGQGVIQGTASDGARQIGYTEFLWDFDVYALYAYSPDNPNFTEAATALINLLQVYLQYYTANDTCQQISPHSPQLTFIAMGGTEYIAAKMTVRASEFLPINY